MMLHVLGFALWLGGLLAAQTAALERARGKEATQALERLEKRFLYLGCHPGMAMSLLSGAGLLAFNSAYFLDQGWLLAKLFFVAVLVALTVLSAAARRRVGTARQPALSLLELKRALSLVTAVLILVLACVRPF
jgi:uncharacterized membrane protein